MIIELRLEQEDDYSEVETLTREAFWGFMNPTCDEHYLAHILRKSDAFIPELDFVAEVGGKLAGNIMYSKAKIVDCEGKEHEVATFGPLSILPEFQSAGVGAALVRHTVFCALEMGYRAIVVCGHPDYYPRFGFQPAKEFGITASDGGDFGALMALELFPNALAGISGKFYEASLFDIEKGDAEEFNLSFPEKKPAEMISIEVLLEKLPEAAQKTVRDKKITVLAWLTRFSGKEILSWNGIGEDELRIINSTLHQYNYAEKLFPSSQILQDAKSGIKVLQRR